MYSPGCRGGAALSVWSPCKILRSRYPALSMVSTVHWHGKDILTSNGVIKGLLGKMTGLIGGIEDLVVEDGKVQGETKADWVSGRKFGGRNLGGCFVGFQ